MSDNTLETEDQKVPKKKEPVVPVPLVYDESHLDEQAELLIVRNIRMKITKALLVEGAVPDDKEKLDFLMRNLKDMDTSALTRKRIQSDEKTAGNNNETIDMVTNLLQALRGGKALPPVDITDIKNPEECAPVLPLELSNYEFVKGENKIGVATEDIDTFRARMNRENPQD